MTRKICFRLTGDTGVADMVSSKVFVVDSLRVLYALSVGNSAC